MKGPTVDNETLINDSFELYEPLSEIINDYKALITKLHTIIQTDITSY